MSNKYVFVGDKDSETPTYLVSATTYALSDANLLADMAAEGVGAPIGTCIVKAGYAAMKQLDFDGSFVSM